MRVLAAGVLVTAAVAAAATVLEIRRNAIALAAEAARLDSLRSAVPRPAAPRTDSLGLQQARALGRVARGLDTPWSALLDALEASLPDDVALVSIEPDASGAKVRLQAEAKSLNDLVAYATTLRSVPAFTGVAFVKHETNEQDANRPVRVLLELGLARMPVAGDDAQ